MGRKATAVATFTTVAVLSAAGLFMAKHGSTSLQTVADESAVVRQSDARDAPKNPGTAGTHGSMASTPTQAPHTATEADTAYELVEVNLRCQIDSEASALGSHVRSTSDELCKDLALKPLSREEVFNAITYAADHGSVRAQLDYALYASRIFEDEQKSLDPDLIRQYKENTVRFLETAGRSGEPQAYVRLSDIYKNGALASKDPVLSYAYAEAYFRTGSSRYGASLLNNATSGLDGAQLRRGKEIADQILNERSLSR